MNVVNTNVQAFNTQNQLSKSQSSLATSMQRLSSGLKINSAKDDSAGLAISERMKAQSSGMDVAARNAADGISFSQTAEGALGEVGEMMGRMRDLAVQAANGTNSTADQANLDSEFQELKSEIDRTLSETKFNGVAMFDGANNGAGAGNDYALTLQVGANAGQTIDVNASDLRTALTASGGTLGAMSVTSQSAASASITALDTAIDQVTSERSNLGSKMNRLESTISNLRNSIENTEASKSRITDADFAKEAANMSRSQVLQQAATSMLAQANAAPQQVLSLVR